LNIFCDREWAGDPETRIYVTGFVDLMNLPVCWRSKAQRGVTLSSSEVECAVFSEAIKEIRFVYFLLLDMRVDLVLPIVVKTDNISVIWRKMQRRAYAHVTWILGITLKEKSLKRA
jgi:hypothetical protein